ncbi:transaldolase family protein [Streptomyces sp. Wb2n-11]|uniref:transaldolase family protein n=1 Tax=Streptomyces sp. Wb2n-11 TaxID=1030533 RepID=UPI000ADC5B0F|nr:transaldolase family protein [Streptomyces sp. Wb2n-11]
MPCRDTVLTDLVHEGVSVWLGGVSRRSLADGTLSLRTADGCVTGAVLSLREMGREVRDGTAYQEQIGLLAAQGVTADEAVRALHLYDARWACDVLRQSFTASRGADGWVCAELDPRFADDARASVAEARTVALAVNRPNLLITVPSTPAGMTVISDCVAEGIGVNAGHIYSVRRYGEVVEAYFEGMGRALAAGRAVTACLSVASFEAARMEAAVDGCLDELEDAVAAPLRGRSALALARAAYQLYEERLGSGRWRKLRAAGARPQRLAWPGAGTPDPATAVRQVEELVAWNTVHTMSQPVLDAVARRGRLRGDTLSGESTASNELLTGLWLRGVSVDRTAEKLARAELRRSVRDRLDLVGSVRDTWRRTQG